MKGPFLRVMYLSRARHRMTRGELADLLAGARLRNADRGVTGMLVYDAGYFVQCLEGPPDAIRTLLAKIENDPRHDEYVLLSEAMAEERLFEGWAMDAANLEFMDDSGHSDLHKMLESSTLEDRGEVYRAFTSFIEEHNRSR